MFDALPSGTVISRLLERERETDRQTRQDKTNSLLSRVVNKHAIESAFFFLHSALAQRGTNILRIHTVNTMLHTLETYTLTTGLEIPR